MVALCFLLRYGFFFVFMFFLLKTSRYVITSYLNFFVRFIFDNGIFSNNRKIARVIPVYENGDVCKYSTVYKNVYKYFKLYFCVGLEFQYKSTKLMPILSSLIAKPMTQNKSKFLKMFLFYLKLNELQRFSKTQNAVKT